MRTPSLGTGSDVRFSSSLSAFYVGQDAIGSQSVKNAAKLLLDGLSNYAIAKKLNADGIRTRYGKEFKTFTVSRILDRVLSSTPTQVTDTQKPSQI